jgi:pimeloyl-ACP methyl ester carboxylesterase
VKNSKDLPMIYADLGRGPPVVLINGLGRTSRHWLGFEQRLIHENLRVITLDMRGLGNNLRPATWDMNMSHLAGDVIEVLDELDIDKAHIFGVSLGGMVGMQLGLVAPQRCASLTVVNSSIGAWSTFYNRLSLRAIFFLLRHSLDRFDVDTMTKELVDLVVGIDMPDDDRKLLALELAALERRFPSSATLLLKQMLTAIRFNPKNSLKNLTMPTQIIVGGYDFFVPRYNSLFIHKLIPKSKFHVISTGGHELMYDKQQALIQLTTTHINQTEQRWNRLANTV